jgi:hypothetical protein
MVFRDVLFSTFFLVSFPLFSSVFLTLPFSFYLFVYLFLFVRFFPTFIPLLHLSSPLTKQSSYGPVVSIGTMYYVFLTQYA